MTFVKIAYDSEAKAWLATSDDVSGLWVEAGSEKELINEVEDLLDGLSPSEEGNQSEATYLKVRLRLV